LAHKTIGEYRAARRKPSISRVRKTNL